MSEVDWVSLLKEANRHIEALASGRTNGTTSIPEARAHRDRIMEAMLERNPAIMDEPPRRYAPPQRPQEGPLVNRFVGGLIEIGFGQEDEINGADCVDLINEFWPELREQAGLPPDERLKD